MKRFLSLFLAVVMVALAVPFTVSASGAATAVWTDTAVTVDGTKDAAYTGAGIAVGDNATAYFAVDGNAIYAFVDVTDSTKSDDYYKNGASLGATAPGVSQLSTNDSVTIGLCYGANGDPANVSNNPGESENAGVVGVFRPVGSATTRNHKVCDWGYQYNGGTAGSVIAVDKADNSGYTAEFKLCFTDYFPLAEVVANGCKMLVQVADSASTAAPGTAVKSSSVSTYTDNIYIWNKAGHYGNNYGTLTFSGAPSKFFSVATAAESLGSVTIDGVKDDIYAESTPLEIDQNGVKAKAYFAYDNGGIKIFVEVEDNTVQEDVFNHGSFKTAANDNRTWNQSPLVGNDSITIAFNASGENSAVDAGTAASNKATAGFVYVYRNTASTAAAGTIHYGSCGNGLNWPTVKTTSTATGWTAEFGIAYKDAGINKSNLDNIAVLVNVVDTDREKGIQDNETAAEIKANVKKGYSNPGYVNNGFNHVYVWQNSTLLTTGYNGFDKLTLAPAEADDINFTAPSKTSYSLGEVLDLSDMVVEAVYYKGETYEKSVALDSAACTVTYDDDVDASVGFTTGGTKTVTVAYGDLSKTFEVTVDSRVLDYIEVDASGAKTTYLEGDILDTTGLIVNAYYVGEATPSVISVGSCSVVPGGVLSTSDTTVTVDFLGESDTYAITVKSKTLTGIYFDALPTKTRYFGTGDSATFDPAGLVLKAVYNNGELEETVAPDAYTLNDTTTDALTTEMTVVGTNTIWVHYGDNFTSVNVEYAAHAYQEAVAAPTVVAPTLDGTKDAVYANATPLYVKNGGTVLATTWIVYDGDYMYLYSEIADDTKVITDQTTNGNITPALRADSFIVTLNFENTAISNLSPNTNDTTNLWGGRYAAMRGATSKLAVTGTYAQSAGWQTVTTENGASGYVVESKIPLKNTNANLAYTVDTSEPVAILISVNDNTGGALDAANCVQYHSGKTYNNGKIVWNTGAYTFKDTAANDNVYDKLTFGDFVVESIEVVSNPTKTYSVDESFYLADAVLKVNYTNGQSATLDASDASFAAYTFTWSDAGSTVDIEITYAGDLAVDGGTATATVVATVAEKKLDGIEVDTTSVDLVYTEGTLFDPTGLIVNGLFRGQNDLTAAPEEITDGYTITIGDANGDDALTTELALGDTQLCVSYGSKVAFFNITVEAKVLDRIAITMNPTKTVYSQGEFLDLTGMEITAYYNNNKNELVSSYTVDVIGKVAGNEVVGAQSKELETTDIAIQINFGGKSVRKTIIVTDGSSIDAVAYETVDAINVDGKKDGDRAYIASLPVGRPGIDAAYGTAYFAYDADYLYVFVEVTDTSVVNDVTGGGGITPSGRNDSVILGLNLNKSNVGVGIYNADGINNGNKVAGWYGVPRSGSLAPGYCGGHAFSNGNSFLYARQNTANGYIVEMRVAWGVDFDAQSAIDAENVSVWVAINDTTGGVISSNPLANTDLNNRQAYWHGNGDYKWNKLTAVEITDISVDATNATVEFEVGDHFSSEGIVLRTEYEDGEFFTSSGFECRSSIYLGRMFTRPGIFTIELLAAGEVVGTYDITVTGDASVATGDNTLAFAPFVAVAAIIALAGVAVLYDRKRRQA